jgi:hypothetical protein
MQIVNTIYGSKKEDSMLIDTTMHVHKNILDMLNEGAEKTGKNITSIIKLLMQRVMKDNQQMIKTNSRIKYQMRDEKEKWHRIHIVLNEYEYEYYLDLRKFFKMSVSFILAYAVIKYLDKLLNRNINTDNYFYRNYIFMMESSDGIVQWKIYWGIPSKLPVLQSMS